MKQEMWVDTKWRPIMGWTYIVICIFDFIVAPIINYIFFAKFQTEFISWKPLTMTEGGLFHISMGAILGITSWTRGKEKLIRKKDEDERDVDYERDFSGNSSRKDR